jgi:CHAT domain
MSGRSTPSPAPLNLDVLFWPNGAGFCAQVVGSPAGNGQTAVFPLPCTDSELTAFIQNDCRFRRASALTADNVDAAKAIGGRLFDAVFSGSVRECLRRSLDKATESGAALRITLRLSNCPALANLPWELLYDRENNDFLVLAARTPVVRYVQLAVPERTTAIEPPLHLLAIRSAPEGTSRLNTAAEWAGLLAALATIDPRKVLVTELENPSLDDLHRTLAHAHTPFHVLHYMGHGTSDPATGGALVFCDKDGGPQFATAAELKSLLQDEASLRLVVLNACEAGRADPADPSAGVAQALVRLGIPSVIAMQFEVTDRAAVKFTPVLYELLAEGSPVEIALAWARKALNRFGLEWVTPVLYSRGGDTRLFEPGEQRDQQDQNRETGWVIPNEEPSVPPRPEISDVRISGDAGDYRIEVRGSGFGQPDREFPSCGTLPNFRIAATGQHGTGEWGYPGTGRPLTYESWTDQEIVAGGLAANPGDAIVLALWNDDTGAGTCWGGNVPPANDTGPVIEDVQFSGPAASPIADIRGRGFGSPPCVTPGTVPPGHLIVGNWRDHPRGSDRASTWTAGVTLRVASWTDERILTSAFTGTFGTGSDTILPGDPLSILYCARGNSQPATQTAWAGRFVSL